MAVSLKHKNALYVNGEWVAADQLEAVINPADESVIAEAPVGSSAHVDAALQAAYDAFHKGPWPRMSVHERQAKLSAFLDAVDARKEQIISLLVAEAGATQMMAGFLQYGIPMKHARKTVEICTRPDVTTLPVELTPNAMGTTTLGTGVLSREPIGVVAAITPYNYPFFLNIGKVIPALAVGCTVVLKPSPYTPINTLLLGEIADEVGLPKGVLNIVTGDIEAGTLLTTDKRVDLVHFTGSDKVGSAIQAQAAPTLKRCIMELGGKSAMIVRADANLQEAIMSGIMGVTVHCAQGCAQLTRHLVHNSIRKQYVEGVAAGLRQVKIGNPIDPTVTYGPLIREVARTRTENYVEIAKSEGARLVTGGRRPDGFDKGFYYEPTLFDDVQNSSRLAQEEVFGPIGAVIGFDTDEEAIAMANDSDFGLSGGIYSADAGLAYEMARQIRTGGVSINGGAGTMMSEAPFGGIKRSGYGREYGIEGLNEFTYMKTISFRAA
ncbi:aldehyde dehydrogenase family protein [Sphingobium sp. Sx8-8]|uniref:aldehyde dehydrogenase family protein n=1 Tax=Sphingobium sp. Sx8-8 TaxID=2933617 RepID=UPI001F5A945B|nr:aldehyde dehydrogenase family protein [Sphingobium sp. Sx8-8]